jgi:hypothetical protein
MPIRLRPAHSAVLVLILLAVDTLPLAGQAGSRPATLERRMRAFIHAVAEEPRDSVAAYFPRRGDWTWVPTLVHGRRRMPPGAWRFRGSETLKVLSGGGPVCNSFALHRGDYGPYEGAFVSRAAHEEGRWRRVRGNRFVPPGASSRSPAFVEWRREDGEWVVSSLGDEKFHRGPRLLGRERNEGTRDRPGRPVVSAHLGYAAGAEWYERGELIAFEGRHYIKYGLPLPLADGEVERIGSLGRVALFVEAGMTRDAGILYIPVSAGQYQPYYPIGSGACE